jgi:hypothetical protein
LATAGLGFFNTEDTEKTEGAERVRGEVAVF